MTEIGFLFPRAAKSFARRRPHRMHLAFTVAAITWLTLAIATPASAYRFGKKSFKRIATFPVFQNFCAGNPDPNCLDETTVAEIVAASKDGKTLIYTDGPTGNIGFVNIANPHNPLPGGLLAMGGEPTSVDVAGNYALVAVNTSPNLANPSGDLKIVHIPSKTVVRTIPLGGQPDSVSVSPNERYAAIAIENERNEDFCVGGTFGGGEADEDDCEDGGGVLGGLPQFPAGFLVIADLVGPPSNWSIRNVSLTGIADKFPEDPETEFVDINALNIAAITLQENNHIVLVDLRTGNVVKDFSAGAVNLSQIDDDDNGLIELAASLNNIPREPDAVAWLSPIELATADEGDLDGGSRGATSFWINGNVNVTSGNTLEHVAVRLGHYPEGRSDNKGNEPEGIEYGVYDLFDRYAFVGSERSSIIYVYKLKLFGPPELVQVLPAGVGPEGLLAIPSRNLFVASSEEDARDDTIRASITIYKYERGEPAYPTIVSANRPDGLPIPWGGLSALAAHPTNRQVAYTAYDSVYEKSRIYTVNAGASPAVINGEIVLHDGSGGTFNFDLEGIAARQGGAGFWGASEGAGNAPSATSPNLLLKIAPAGEVLQQIQLPANVNSLQRSAGFEGVASVGSGAGELVYVAFQRTWTGDPAGQTRIGRYRVSDGTWTFFYYQLDASTSPVAGAQVGLSEIVAVSNEEFAVLERDDQAGTDAALKKIYKFSIAGLTPQPQGTPFPLVQKVLVRDLIPDLQAPKGAVLEKVEGLAILANGDTILVNDNDGLDPSNGETQFIHLGDIF